MALNTTFTSGAILTAAQMNNLPWGIVSATSVTTASGSTSTEVTRITAASFTAVANRYYRITYFEPALQFISGTVNLIELTIKIGGVAIQFGEVKISSASDNTGTVSITKTLTAGATVVTATMKPVGGGNANAYSAATAIAQLVIEDMGST